MSKKDTPMPMRSSKGNQSHPRGGILRIVVTLAIAVVVTVLAFAPRGALAAAEQSGETGDSAVAAASPDGADSSAAAGATAPSATGAAGTSATSAPSADATDSSASLATVLGTSTVQIQYDEDTDIHYALDPESASGRIILYCMNNQSHWPHTTPSISNVPSYIEGYLTPEK